MTLDELHSIYWNGNDFVDGTDGIRRVVMAMKWEIVSRIRDGESWPWTSVDADDWFDEILGDAGEKAAGSSGVGSNPTLAADFCEVQPLDSTRHLRGCSKYPTYDPIRPFCGNCGKPIKVQEQQT